MKANKNENPLKTAPIHRPKSLAMEVADRLKHSILQCDLSLGEALSEDGIASAMGVSRTPVREALTILQLQGLINIIPQRGSYVFKPEREDIEALVEYRLSLEILASGLALERAQAATLASLKEALKEMDRARENDDSLQYAHADTTFHNAFFENCGNHYFVEAFDIASGRIAALRAHLSKPLGLHRKRTYSEHVEIIKAFERGDASAVKRLLTKHIKAMSPNYTNVLNAIAG